MTGDLDAYILNNSFIPVNTLNYSNKRSLRSEDWPVEDFVKGGGDKLMRNEGDRFANVNDTAGIYSSLIGFGLGITIGDINQDHYPDIYISNDFFERDYLYVNQHNGTFKEELESWMDHISLSSMGADMADINNDGAPELFVTEMLPSTQKRLKTTTNFENYSTYQLKLSRGFYHQYMHNTLQLNNRDNTFSEVSWFAGVSSSDWSWGALFFDADLDGYEDIYVCNGIYQDVTDQDFIDFFANDIVQNMVLTGEVEEFNEIVAKMPSNPQVNSFFHNQGDLTFKEVSQEWGTDIPTFSNGAAYGDLDNDGDLDLVISNVNQPSMIYENQRDSRPDHHYIKIHLEGESPNPYAIGSEVRVYSSLGIMSKSLIPSRGFQSSMDYDLIFGLNGLTSVDSLKVIWPDRAVQVIANPSLDTILHVRKQGAFQRQEAAVKPDQAMWERVTEHPFLPHQEDEFSDFYQEGLLFRSTALEGPPGCVLDVNNDGRDDVFIGGAVGKKGKLYIQEDRGFNLSELQGINSEGLFEDTEALVFDANGDGYDDLFVGSGGNHLEVNSPYLSDRLYFNDGSGTLRYKSNAIPAKDYSNTSSAYAFDLDEDGDLDLLIGARNALNNYGAIPEHRVLRNNGDGIFTNVTKAVAPWLLNVGMITEIGPIDIDGDDQNEIVILGEWMSPKVISVHAGRLKRLETNLREYSGWWYGMAIADVNQDGLNDLILGNRGENFYFSGSSEAPAKLWLSDFDRNGSVEKIITQSIQGRDIPVTTKRELTNQIVSLKKQNLKHQDYADKSMQEIFTPEEIKRAKVLEANYFLSAVALNLGDNQFDLRPLPREAQFSSIHAIQVCKVNQDEFPDLVLAGNDRGFIPQFSRLDANHGLSLTNRGDGTYAIEYGLSFGVKGDVKRLLSLTIADEPHLLFLINNDYPQLFKVIRDIEL